MDTGLASLPGHRLEALTPPSKTSFTHCNQQQMTCSSMVLFTLNFHIESLGDLVFTPDFVILQAICFSSNQQSFLSQLFSFQSHMVRLSIAEGPIDLTHLGLATKGHNLSCGTDQMVC